MRPSFCTVLFCMRQERPVRVRSANMRRPAGLLKVLLAVGACRQRYCSYLRLSFHSTFLLRLLQLIAAPDEARFGVRQPARMGLSLTVRGFEATEYAWRQLTDRRHSHDDPDFGRFGRISGQPQSVAAPETKNGEDYYDAGPLMSVARY
jgi:hypothetical protein